ncbi:NAD+ diphosphatase [Bisgaardia hudsonensis]|uniref:NAD-capped RNA hydrolase NudC n=1 Tax=Bisgaardia hudsonensis TaxID=109472 RepID=A0A4R2MWT5_9PAST|nr:NAD(+) diphosphatase [Bisgaardia hudsonensis]QLB13817.1 NADH pyrophosphatase [Bisgaardia hudsonensis]TCP11699.1 NAD+ diphosphatase [Bisgaardia hudsonensis]
MEIIKQDDIGFWLFTRDFHIYLVNGNLPQGRADDFELVNRKAMCIGKWQGLPLMLVEEIENDNREYVSLRDLLYLPEKQFNLLNRGIELNYFLKSHQYCGKCGSKNNLTQDEWAVQCSNVSCNYRCYPVICPSIIVAIRRNQEILLANHVRHIDGMYTTLAGFVEVGERFEDTVEREIFEETGLKVKNIRYFGSQPWAFPNSEMVGFLADYDSGEICLQKEELRDARWFRYDEELPILPPEGTIALKLIQATLEICKKEDKLS